MSEDTIDSKDTAPYFEDILSDISDRDVWNRKDDLILTRRLGERTKNTPYTNAPNPVEPIIDDTTAQITDAQISMQMNTPFLAIFQPRDPNPKSLEAAQKAMKGFDTLLRHYMGFRKKQEVAIDCKNARGFSVVKRVREFNEELGEVIPSFVFIDPKDMIVPVDTEEAAPAERLVHVMRLSPRKLKKKRDQKGWMNVDKLLENLKLRKDGDGSDQALASSDGGPGEGVNVLGYGTGLTFELILEVPVALYARAGRCKPLVFLGHAWLTY